MRDVDIREGLLRRLRSEHPNDLIRNEVGICGGATRVDVAVVNCALHGYEIKSARDSLARLPSQVELYGKSLHFVTVIGAGSHIKKLWDAVPDWWGIEEALPNGSFEKHRAKMKNPSLDLHAVAQLLWRDEAAQLLTEQGYRVTRKQTRWDLWDLLSAYPEGQLTNFVCQTLKARSSWPGGQ